MYLSLNGILEQIKLKYNKHLIMPKNYTTFKAFDKHYQYIIEIEDFQDKYLETIKLMYEIVQQHILTDGNKRLSLEVFRNLLGEDLNEIERKLGK